MLFSVFRVSLPFRFLICLSVKWDVRVGGQALVQTSVKLICFRALPTRAIPVDQEMHRLPEESHATTPFRTTGLAG